MCDRDGEGERESESQSSEHINSLLSVFPLVKGYEVVTGNKHCVYVSRDEGGGIERKSERECSYVQVLECVKES